MDASLFITKLFKHYDYCAANCTMYIPWTGQIAVLNGLGSTDGVAESVVDSLDVVIHRVFFDAGHVPDLISGSAWNAGRGRSFV